MAEPATTTASVNMQLPMIMPPRPIPAAKKGARPRTISERFEIFHDLNPHVYRAIVVIATDRKNRDWKHISINSIFEELRLMYASQTKGDVFALNNSYRAFYARLVMEREPHLSGVFETRQQTCQGAS